MQIFQSDLDDRLGKTFHVIEGRATNAAEKYFMIVHPYLGQTPAPPEAINNLKRSIKKHLNNECAGILFVKGARYAGLDKGNACNLQSQFDNKIHFLSYAVVTRGDLPKGYDERFKTFFENIQNENIIDWNLIDPPPKESIVAALLLLRAALHDCNVQEEEVGSIWQDAVRAYKQDNASDETGIPKTFPLKDKCIQKSIKKLDKFLSNR